MFARPAGGFTLIEVLVALLVVAMGVLGATATQAMALRTRHQSALMSRAAQLGASLAERMRANPAAMAGAASPYLQLDYDASGTAPPPPSMACHGAADCTPAELAAFDLYEVQRAVHEDYPRGRVRVCRDVAGAGAPAWDCVAGAGAPIVIKIGWRMDGEDGKAAGPAMILVVPEGA